MNNQFFLCLIFAVVYLILMSATDDKTSVRYHTYMILAGVWTAASMVCGAIS